MLLSTSSIVFPGPSFDIPRQYRILIHYSSSPQAKASNNVPNVARLVLKLLQSNSTMLRSVDSLVVHPASFIDGYQVSTFTALTFALIARRPMAIIGPTFALEALNLTQLQTSLGLDVPIISYGSTEIYELRNSTAYPYLFRNSVSTDNHVKFLVNIMRFCGQMRVGVVWSDDRQYAYGSPAIPIPISDSWKYSLLSWQSFRQFQELANEYGIHIASAVALPFSPTKSDFLRVIQTFQSLNISTVVLLLPYKESFKEFASASFEAGFNGLSVPVFAISSTIDGLGVTLSTNLTKTPPTPAVLAAKSWLMVNQNHVINTAAYRLFYQAMFAAKLETSKLWLSYIYPFVHDSIVVCDILLGLARASGDNLMQSSSFWKRLRATDFLEPAYKDVFASGPPVMDPLSNDRIGARGQVGIMNLTSTNLVGQPTVGVSLDDFSYQPLPALFQYSPLTPFCTSPGWALASNISAPTSQRVTQAPIECLPCPVGTYSPLNEAACLPCDANSLCPLASPSPYRIADSILSQTVRADTALALQIGTLLSTRTYSEFQATYFTALYAMLGAAAFVGLVLIVVVSCSASLGKKVNDAVASVDILFTRYHPLKSAPLEESDADAEQSKSTARDASRKTSSGGFAFVAFCSLSVLAIAYYSQKMALFRFMISAASSPSFSNLLSADRSTVSALSFNVTFFGIHNTAACAKICEPPPVDGDRSAQRAFIFSPESDRMCNATLDSATSSVCAVSFTSLQVSTNLPNSFFCNISIENSQAQFIAYEVSSLLFVGKWLSLRGPIYPTAAQAPSDLVLQGPAASTVQLLLTPIQFVSTAAFRESSLADRLAPASGVVGHIVGFGGLTIGSTADDAALRKRARESYADRTARVSFQFSRTQTVSSVTLTDTLEPLVSIPTASAGLALLMVLVRTLMIAFEWICIQVDEQCGADAAASTRARAKSEAAGDDDANSFSEFSDADQAPADSGRRESRAASQGGGNGVTLHRRPGHEEFRMDTAKGMSQFDELTVMGASVADLELI
jgi:hypothetical protein